MASKSRARDEEEERLTQAEDFEYRDDGEDAEDEEALPSSSRAQNLGTSGEGPATILARSPYRLPASEQLRGVANRILFSRYYIVFYLVMTGLSMTTVIFSLLEGGCPSMTWHILEVVVNGGMVLEVGTRWVAFGKQYPLTPLNILDLVLTLFCVLTLLIVFLNPCGEGSKREEVLDTLLLVIRNGVQFWRLGTILRRSGHSLLHPPRPIDLTQARNAAFTLDLNLDDDEALAEHHLNHSGGAHGLSTNVPYAVVPGSQREPTVPQGDRSQAGRDRLESSDEDAWDRMG